MSYADDRAEIEDLMACIDRRWLFKRRRIANEFIKGRQSGRDNPARSIGTHA